MAASRYEKYVVRKPGVITSVTADSVKIEVPEGNIPRINDVDTGPLVILSDDLVKEANTKVEYGFISGDTTIGGGTGFGAHKHDYAEVFLFRGTNPQDTTDLGAEVEFWLGEGNELEKIKISTSSSVYVPPGVAHFPLFYRNVKRPVMMEVIVPHTSKHKAIPVKREGMQR